MSCAVVIGASFLEILRDLGYVGLALLMLIETVFPPIPSEAVLPLAGYLVERGELQFAGVVAASTFGSTAGAMVLYEAVRQGGRPFASRFMRFARIDPARLDEAERWFARRGPLVVLVGRCVPGVRSAISLPAGLLRMPRWEYLIFTVVGSLAWNVLLVAAGYALGSQWHRISAAVGAWATPLLVGVVVAVAGVLLWRGLRGRSAS